MVLSMSLFYIRKKIIVYFPIFRSIRRAMEWRMSPVKAMKIPAKPIIAAMTVGSRVVI